MVTLENTRRAYELLDRRAHHVFADDAGVRTEVELRFSEEEFTELLSWLDSQETPAP